MGGPFIRGSKTINTEIQRLVEEKKKLSTGVKEMELRVKEGATTLVMDKKRALELAEKIMTFAHVLEEDKRINLTVLRGSNGVTITSY
ncbi:hypothetical protein GCM10011391_37450 [Pullulanibacillus camelliae]|uniref:Uncharacterized protein n=1 Tax=Pullulanibacillus camelliae TaxID=1707096 RepID=A0A8J3E0P1_9BACL|nr:hypothetical protein [Pullulanibacillus camelliae]GGE55000.1 hypothetical protein GCM10011391_37450 [Pullulanibacillus camelliae]